MIKSYLFSQDGKSRDDVLPGELAQILNEESHVLWLDFFKATPEEIKILSEVFRFHPLSIEDCTSVIHHPKIDNFEDYIFMVLHAPDLKRTGEKIRTTEIDIFLGKNFVVTYHEQPIRAVSALQEKCQKNIESVLSKGADFVMYLLVDSIMENYMPILDKLDERIERCIDSILHQPSSTVLDEIFSLKRGLLYLRRVISPQRDTINRLTREEFHYITSRSRVYFRDVYDRLIRIFDLLETYRDVIIGAQDTYLSSVSQRTNDVIRVLTIVSTIIMPPSLIASIFGMNFRFMPELTWKWGYPFSLGLMAASSVIMLYLMKKNKWF